MNKHTQGEWIFNSERSQKNFGELAIYAKETMEEICIINFPHLQQESQANAKLIAAAPDLLEALKKFVATEDFAKMANRSNGQFNTAYNEAKEAIKKATE